MDTIKFRFIDLFAGIGGFRLALSSLGGQCVFSSEWDKYAQMTYERNFGQVPTGDIVQIDEDSIPDHDILTAGFPCQPFSIAGVTKNNALGISHGLSHATQGHLFFEVTRILRKKRPKAFFLENVKNLKSHDKGKTFEVIRRTLEDELGYHIYYKIIDARTLVPQHRERIYIVGFEKPLKFDFPVLPDFQPKFRDILEERVDDKYTLSDSLWTYLQNYAAKHRAKGNGFGYGLTDLDGIARTLSARYYKDGAEILIPQKKRNPRRLTPRECARLMGFPDTYKLVCSDTRTYKQFGNSVVVPVITLIARDLVKALYPGTPIASEKQTTLLIRRSNEKKRGFDKEGHLLKRQGHRFRADHLKLYKIHAALKGISQQELINTALEYYKVNVLSKSEAQKLKEAGQNELEI